MSTWPRVEFAFVTINHCFFVPVTMGLGFLTALLQTAWYRTNKDEYLRLARSCTASGL
jgi:cytochrome bd ubiquinol oxidase subunit I